MKVLLVNKFHWLKGGSETYYFELGKMLKSHGHEVAYFSMDDNKNIKTGDKEYFVKAFNSDSKNVFKSYDAIYSSDNKKIMLKVLDEYKPDIVHVNLFQRHLTYSILCACKEKRIPVIYTAHDLQSVCPASAMLCDGKICEKCLNGSKYNCFKNKCVKNSKLKSLLSSIESNIYKNKKVYEMFDTIISPSNFVGNMIKKEWKNTNIKTIYNFVDTDAFNDKNNKDENYAFFLGRLSIEKGIMNLLQAFCNQSNGKLYIAGDGPEREKIKKYISDNKLNKRVTLLGYLNKEEVKKYISNCSFVVVPSVWYENCPYSILETFSIGKPVIGSKIGGIPELIVDGKNGFLYDYNDVDKLSKLIKKLFDDSNKRKEMGKNARKYALEKYNKEVYYKQLMSIYNKLVVK